MFSNLFAAECEDEHTPSYLDRIIEAAETAKSRVNEISEDIANTVASPKEALESLVTSAKDAVGDFSLPARASEETVANATSATSVECNATSEDGNATSPFAALVATARDVVGHFAISARESVEAVGDAASPLAAAVDSARGSVGELVASAKDAMDCAREASGNFSQDAASECERDGARSPREVIAAYAATAKSAIVDHAVAVKESVAESMTFANDPTYYVETTYARENLATPDAMSATSLTDAIKEGTARVSEFAESAAGALADGVASAQKTMAECSFSEEGVTSAVVAGARIATDALVEGVVAAKDTVVEGAKAAFGEGTVNDADCEAKDEDKKSDVKSSGPISASTAFALVGAAALPVVYSFARKSV